MRGWDPVSIARFDVPWPCGSAYDSRAQVTGLGTPNFLKLQRLLKWGYQQGYSAVETDGD